MSRAPLSFKASAPKGRGPTIGAVGRMNTHTPGIDGDRKRADRLDVARKLYKALVAEYPGRLITLCDGRGRALARSEQRPEQDAAENVS
jgi:hypothetical protein